MGNLAAGGIAGAVAKTITAPMEKVKLAIQNQDSNPRIVSGEMPRYKGMGDCYARHIKELGITSLWRGNVANCIRYVPTAAFNLMFKDNIKRMFPKYNKNTDFGKFAASQIASGAAAGGVTNTLVYPLIYVRTVLGADIGKVKKFNGMGDALVKTARQGGFLSLYNGIGPSTVGIVVYRGAQFGLQDIVKAFNPWQQEFRPGVSSPSSASPSWPSRSRASAPTRSTPCSVASKSKRRSQLTRRCTTAWLIASRRSWQRRAPKGSSRAPSLIFFAVLERPSSWLCTMRS